jgi:hypothetical protein
MGHGRRAHQGLVFAALHRLERVGFIRLGMPYLVSHRFSCVKGIFSISLMRGYPSSILVRYIYAVSHARYSIFLFVRLHRYV